MSIHDKINKRFTQVQIQKMILDDIMPLLRSNHTFPQISRILQSKYNKSGSQCDQYIMKAVEALKQDFNRDVEQQRIEHISGLEADLEEAYANYKEAEKDRDRSTWWKEYQAVKKRIADISPNELKPKEEQEELTINIQYGDADE